MEVKPGQSAFVSRGAWIGAHGIVEDVLTHTERPFALLMQFRADGTLRSTDAGRLLIPVESLNAIDAIIKYRARPRRAKKE